MIAVAKKSLEELLAGTELVGEDGLTFVGGSLEDHDALAGLLAWAANLEPGLAFRFVEWTDRMRLSEAAPALPAADELLVGARWFGEGGDLEVWRAGTGFGWRFIGPPAITVPSELNGASFFEEERCGLFLATADNETAAAQDENSSPMMLREGPQGKALLWPENHDRIATADPETRAFLKRRDAGISLTYRPFFHRGVLSAVWFTGFSGKEGA